MEKETIPDEALFFVADASYSIDQILRAIYGNPSSLTRDHFLRVNSHLTQGRVRPGQIVIITPPDSLSCQGWELAMQEAARVHDLELQALTDREKRMLARNYAFLSDAVSYTSTMYGWTNGYFKQKTELVKRILEQLDRLYVTSYQRHGHLRSDNFFAQRRALFSQLDQVVNGMVRKELFGASSSSAGIKRQFGLSSKATVHQWSSSGNAKSVSDLSGRYERLSSASKAFSRLGYVAIGLEVTGGVANIARACAEKPGSDSCTKMKYTETGRVVGSVSGGMLGGTAAAYGTCNLLFGLETAGTSLLWCAVVAGAAGSYGGSKLGGEFMESTGEVLYEARVK